MRLPHLLSPGRIGPLELRNRIVMAPMGANLAESDGHAGARMWEYFAARARGGAGLIIVDVGAVAYPHGVSNPYQLGLSSDEFVPDLAELAARVHEHGAAIAIQLHHGSKVAVRDIISGRPMWVPSEPGHRSMDLYNDLSADDLSAATSEIIAAGHMPEYHVMDVHDIDTAREWYVAAALRVQRVGFDGVELHAGHGYLLQSFLSPATNHRDDEYGGHLENRARFLREVLTDIRARTGDGFAVWVRLDGCEFGIDGGITLGDAGATAEICAAAGAHAIHVSAYADPGMGAAFTVAPIPHEPGAYLGLARAIKERVDVPVIAVGRIEPAAGDAAIADGGCDFVAMGRKLLADPDLPNKLSADAADDIRPCIYAYRCVGNIFLSKRTRCVVNPATGREHEVQMPPASPARRVLVVGGGPAGMETARVAAQRGHDVVLWERSDHLGGMAAVAAQVDLGVASLIEWQERQMQALGVKVRLDARVSREAVEKVKPDAVVLATGRVHAKAGEGTPVDLEAFGGMLGSGVRLEEPIVILGSDAVAVRIAECLVLDGYEVAALLDGEEHLGSPLSPPRLWRALGVLRREHGVPLVTNMVDVRPEAATLIDARLGAVEAPLERELADGPWELHAVGDCRAANYLDGAFDDAWEVAGNL